MITDESFPVDPWHVRETQLDLNLLAQSESLFTLSNGHIGLRGNLDEGEPYGLPGTYLNSFYEIRPLPYAEGGYGYPEAGQAIVNVTNGKIIRLLVEDEPFDIRYGELRHHSVFWTSGPEFCAGPSSGSRRPDARFESPRPGWFRSPSERSLPSSTRSNRYAGRHLLSSSQSSWQTSGCRRVKTIRAPPPDRRHL